MPCNSCNRKNTCDSCYDMDDIYDALPCDDHYNDNQVVTFYSHNSRTTKCSRTGIRLNRVSYENATKLMESLGNCLGLAKITIDNYHYFTYLEDVKFHCKDGNSGFLCVFFDMCLFFPVCVVFAF